MSLNTILFNADYTVCSIFVLPIPSLLDKLKCSTVLFDKYRYWYMNITHRMRFLNRGLVQNVYCDAAYCRNIKCTNSTNDSKKNIKTKIILRLWNGRV